MKNREKHQDPQMQHHERRFGNLYGPSQSLQRSTTSSGVLAMTPCQPEKTSITGMFLMTPDAQTTQTQWKIPSMLFGNVKTCKQYGKLPHGDVD